jgi:hypothetical protein
MSVFQEKATLYYISAGYRVVVIIIKIVIGGNR